MVCECDYLYRMDDTADTHWYMRETGQLVRIDATNADFLHLFSPAADLSWLAVPMFISILLPAGRHSQLSHDI